MVQCLEQPVAVRPRHRTYLVEGGYPLRGRIVVAGAKNAVTKQMVATLLTDEPCLIQNVPRTTEVAATLRMLSGLGTRHAWLAPDALELHTPRLEASAIDPAQARLNRIPLLALSPLLHRTGEAWVPLPGGCRIGERPAGFHLALLSRMGARVEHEGGGFAAWGRLRGATVELPYPSVGATENALFAAVLAPGRSRIVNAAVEPEILDTVAFLQSMGARIELRRTRTFQVEGVRRLTGARHRVLGDRTEAASFAFAAAATGGHVAVAGIEAPRLRPLCRLFAALGGQCRITREGILFTSPARVRPIAVESAPYPGLSTDWMPPLLVAMTQACGRSTIHESVFENRLGYAEMLRATGARLAISDGCPEGRACRFAGQGHAHVCTVAPSRLHGASMLAPDLRGGFAMLLAALVAEGRSEIGHMERVERGYAGLAEKLQTLGARLRRSPVPLGRAA